MLPKGYHTQPPSQPQAPWGNATTIAQKDLPSWFTASEGTNAGTLKIYQMMGMSGPDGRIIRRNSDGTFTQYAGRNQPGFEARAATAHKGHVAPGSPLAASAITPAGTNAADPSRSSGAAQLPMTPQQQAAHKAGGGGRYMPGTGPGKQSPAIEAFVKQAGGGSPQSGAGSALSYQSGINVGGGIGKNGILSGLLDTGTQSDRNVSAFTQATARNDASQIGRGIDAQNQQMMMAQQAKRSESVVAGASNLAKMHGDMAERRISQKGLAAQIAANNIGFGAGLTGAFNPLAALGTAQSAYGGGAYQ